MKKIPAFVLFSLIALALGAQTSVKRYVTLEHFTNSKCPICASKNPAFYTLIDQYPDDIHHVSIHPSVPYASCVFHQANTADNEARADYYNIPGTPRVAVNGTLLSGGSQLLPAATLQAALNQTSPVHVAVTENNSGNQYSCNIRITTLGDVPAGTYQLVAYAVEQEVNYATSNGETVHHNVMRKLLNGPDGLVFSLPPVGGEVSFEYNYTLSSTVWPSGQIYVLALVQNATTKEVLNSGTRFDPVFVDAPEPAALPKLSISPNPAIGQTYISLPADEALDLQLFDANGHRVQARFSASANNATLTLDTQNLAPGLYMVQVAGKKGVYSGKIITSGGGF